MDVVKISRGRSSCLRARSDRKRIVRMSRTFCRSRLLLRNKLSVCIQRDCILLCVIYSRDLMLLIQPGCLEPFRSLHIDASPAASCENKEGNIRSAGSESPCVVTLAGDHIVLCIFSRSHIGLHCKGVISFHNIVEHVIERNRKVSSHDDSLFCPGEGCAFLIRNRKPVLALIHDQSSLALEPLDFFQVIIHECLSVLVLIYKLFLRVCQLLILCLQLFDLVELAVGINNESVDL